MQIPVRLALCACVIGGLLGPAFAKDDPPADAKSASQEKTESEKKSASSPTHTVKAERFRITVELDGVFESTKTEEVSIVPKSWTDLVVTKAVERGTKVQRGEPIIWIETEKLDRQIADVKADRELSALSIKQAENELRLLKETLPLQLESAQRIRHMAAEDYDYFNETRMDLLQRMAEQSVETAEQQRKFSREELHQLEKMYQADDLTEETEEIILDRARFYVKMSEFAYDMAVTQRDETLKIQLPRNKDQLYEAAEQARLALDRVQSTLPSQLRHKQLELEKLGYEQQKKDRSLKELEQDRQLLTITAPADGIVYYGAAKRGKWTTAAALTDKLRPGGKIAAHEVLMTVVDPDRLIVRAAAPEKELGRLEQRQTATVRPTAFPDRKLAASLERLSTIPNEDLTFDVRLNIVGDSTERLVAGMTAKISVSIYDQKHALTVPASAVFEDDDEDTRYVFLDRDGKAKRQTVKLGRKSDDRVEIIEGLAAGDMVRTQRPTDDEPLKKPADDKAEEEKEKHAKEKPKDAKEKTEEKQDP